MKTTKFVSALIAIFALAFLSTLESCQKTDDQSTSPEAVTKSALLSAGGWVMKTATMNTGAPAGSVDLYVLMDDVDKDDIIYFNSDKSATTNAGVAKYDANQPQTTTDGTWALADNDTKVVITNGEEVTELAVVTLNSTELVVEVNGYDASLQTNVTQRFGFTH